MRKYDKWITLFGGWLGIHRYLSGEIGMGLLYTCTFGGCYVGWLHDVYVVFAPPASIWRRWSDVSGEAADLRKRRALDGELTPVRIYPESKKAVFAGSDGGRYRTSLTKCTCPDFQKRKVPCKHMYYLATKCDIDI